MAEADLQVAWPVGVKKTKVRERVLSLLGQAKSPLTAFSISAELEKTGEPVWLSTVYRTLQVLTDSGMITRTDVMENGMAMYALNRHEHRHYAVCLGCHRVIAIENCPLEGFTPQLTERGFRVLGHKLEMYGYCDGCYLKQKEPSGTIVCHPRSGQ